MQCCSPDFNGGGGWGIFNAILGWNNTATYGSVISYNVYWIAVITAFVLMRYKETKGHWPFMKPKAAEVSERSQAHGTLPSDSGSSIHDHETKGRHDSGDGKSAPEAETTEKTVTSAGQ